jgi:endogenous inhibitor of DNA gyrase (YacG/DUF329 family)
MKTTSAVVCIRCSKPTSGGIYIVDGTSTRGPYCPTCAQIVVFEKEPQTPPFPPL